MQPLLIVLFILILLLLPINIGAEVYLNATDSKLNFGIYIYKRIKLLRGKILFKKDKAILQIWSKKINLPYKKIVGGNNSLDVFYGFYITELSTVLEVGSEKSKFTPIAAAVLYNLTGNVILSALKTYNPQMISRCSVNIFEGKDILEISANIYFLLNVLLIILAAIKKITEKIINGKAK